MTQREDKAKERTSREELGKFFFDIAKATFTVMVLTNTIAMFINKNFELAIGVFVIGVFATYIMAQIGYSIIKK